MLAKKTIDPAFIEALGLDPETATRDDVDRAWQQLPAETRQTIETMVERAKAAKGGAN